MRRPSGFTQVELIGVIALIGIVAAVAIPRFADRVGFDSRGFSDQLVNSLQYARQQAVAQRRQMCVAVAAGGYAITRAPAPGGACDGTPLLAPDTGAAYAANVPNGVGVQGEGTTALPASINFDPLGRPNAAAALRVTGDIPRCLRVEGETGYVRFVACS